MSGSLFAARVREVLENKAVVPVEEGTAVLREKEKRKTIMQVEVVAIPDGVAVINVEKIGELSGVRGRFRSRCDYLILFQKADVAAAVFVELKKTLSEGTRGLEQLRRSPPYLEYLRAICSIEFDGRSGSPSPVTMHYLLIGERVTPQLSKQRVSDPQALPVEKHLGITVHRKVGKRLHFDRLRGFVL